MFGLPYLVFTQNYEAGEPGFFLANDGFCHILINVANSFEDKSLGLDRLTL